MTVPHDQPDGARPDAASEWAPPHPPEDPRARASRLRLAAMLMFMGTMHFLVPRPFMRLVPRRLGSARVWVLASGVWELASGALLLSPRTRRAGGYAAAATIVAVYPGNIKMALDAGPPRTLSAVTAWGRLPLQVPLLAWAMKQARA